MKDLICILLSSLSLGYVLTSCIDGTTTENTESPRMNIGFIADHTRTTKLDPPIMYINCNMTLEWFYTDFSEPYQIYKTVKLLDTKRQDIDLIVMIDFGWHHMQLGSILNTEHKDIIKLHRRSGHLNQASLRSLVFRLTNGTYDISGHVTSGHAHCCVGYNITNTTSDNPYFTDTVAHVPPLILANLAAQQGWKSIFVLYDTHSEHVTRLYLDSLSIQGILFAPYNMDEVDDLHVVLLDMYNRTANHDQKLYISVICSLECLFKVLEIANNFDTKNTELPTLLSQFSRWLLLVYDYTHIVAKVIETIAHDLDNVVVVPVPEFTPPSVKAMISKVKRTLSLQEFKNETNEKNDYLRIITQGLVTMDQTALCTHYNIDSLVWKNKGRELRAVGNANLHGKVKVRNSELFPNTQYGYSNRTFKVTTNMYSPYVIKTVDKNNKTEYGGIYIDLLRELSRVLNFSFEIILPPDGNWGVLEDVVNGTEVWNGMIGMLQRREIDLVAAPLTIIPARDKIIDFSYPVSYEYTSIVVKQPDPNAVKWRTLINPFKLEVLLYIGVSLPIVTVLVCLFEKFGPYYSDENNARIRKEVGGLHHLHDAFWYMYGALLCQGGVRLPDSFAGRTYVSAWWIFCIIIVGTYGGNLIAFLTVSRVASPFNTIDEMLEMKGTYKWGTLAGTVLETVFVTSSNPQFRRVGDAMLEFNKTDPDIFHENSDFHEARIAREQYAYITYTTSIEILMSKTCDLTTIKERLFPMKDAFAFQHNSPHTQVFSRQIMKSHEAGLFEIWRRKWWPKQSFCTDKAKFESKPITLRDVQSGFYLCVIGIFLGTVAFVAEILVYKLRKRRNNTQTSDSINDNCDNDIEMNDIAILY